MKSLNIAWYISDHGFGHVMRNIPIIKALLEAHPEVKVYVKTGALQMQQLHTSLQAFQQRLILISEEMDIGLVLQKGSLLIDESALFSKVSTFVASFEGRVLEEETFLTTECIDLIISDIVPWILPIAKRIGIASLLISNFTWVEIYKEYLPAHLVSVYENCYKAADEALFYSLYDERMKRYLPFHTMTSLVSRPFDATRASEIKAKYTMPLVFISVGRSVLLDEIIDVSDLPYQFVVTQGICLKGDNVEVLPVDVPDTHNYILASDYVISKAGWGTVAEVLLARKPLALLSRDTVAEDRQTIHTLADQNLCIVIEEVQLSQMGTVLMQMKNTAFLKSEQYNDSTQEISQYIYKKAKKGNENDGKECKNLCSGS